MHKIFLVLATISFFTSTTSVFALSEDHFSETNSIDFLVNKGVVEGYEDGSLRPYSKVNRAELLKIALELAKHAESMYPRPNISNDDIIPKLGNLNNCFPDVQDEWFAPYVCYAKQKGIVRGYDSGNFNPEKTVTLAEATKIISKIFALETTSHELWYRGYIEYFTDRMYLPYTITSPNQEISRGEAAIMLYRLSSDGPGSYYCPLSIFDFQEDGSLEVKSFPECQ